MPSFPRPCSLLAAAVAFAAIAATPNALRAQRRSTAAALTGPGVAAQLATTRRAQLGEVAYDLAMTVNSGDTATGTVTISFVRRGAGDVVLDFRGLSVGNAQVNGAAWPDVARAWNRHHITVPAAQLKAGRNSVTLSFATPVASAGAAIIRTRDAADSSTYLYTLLVPSDANLLFPCFDQPDLKARVTFRLSTPPSWRALANGAATRTDSTASGVTHHFATTKPLSTYLIAFAAGPWHVHTRRDSIAPGGAAVKMSLYMRASRAKEAEADTLLAMNARALRWLGAYFGVPYGFDKYDALLAPAFPFGGMEHPGAVFYNEESFIYRERPTASQLLGRQATTFHEVAHQWFGDYVTMRWFDDLWLKEGFATFMAARMQADLEPTSNAWKTFYLRNKPVAYGTDATAGTTPVWQALANLDQAKSNYGPIVYNKAPSMLRQLEYLVGPRSFQLGVQRFLAQHAYGNATWQALLAAIGTAAGRDLTVWGRQWMLRPGMPIISQQLEVANGRITRLRLVQRPAQPGVSGAGAWPLKVQLRLHHANGRSVSFPVELRGDTTIVTQAAGLPAPDFVFANEGDYGYAIVLPDSASVSWLEQHVGEVRDDFLRAMLWGAMWDLVREGELAPVRFARMATRALPGERDEQLASALVGRLGTTLARYAAAPVRDALLPEVERLLLTGAQDTSAAYGSRKAHLDAYVSLARRDGTIRQLRRWLAGDSAAGLPLRAPSRWAMVTTLVAQGASDRDSLIAAERRRDDTTEGERLAFVAAAAAPDSATKQALFDRWFRDGSLNEEWVQSSLRAFHDVEQQQLTRRYITAALDTLPWIQQNRRIFFLGSWLSATLGGQTEREALELVDAWLAAHPALAPDLRQKVLQSRDELQRTVRVRERFATEVDEAPGGVRVLTRDSAIEGGISRSLGLRSPQH
jgi:aminopeptidase N